MLAAPHSALAGLLQSPVMVLNGAAGSQVIGNAPEQATSSKGGLSCRERPAILVEESKLVCSITFHE